VIRLVEGAGPSSALDECPWLTHYPVSSFRRDPRGIRKRAFDEVVATLLLALGAPLLLVSIAAIKISSPRGTVLFRQRRTGFGGRQFTLYKLRTMAPDAELRKVELAHLNSRQWPDFKIERDPRVTKVGRVLRATSIDELPQLFNVLRGDMSLVGPRPTSLPADGYQRWQYERFAVRPGLTGLWQVSARGSSSFDHRLRLDIAYATRQSLRLDVEILVRTIPAVFMGRGAV